MLRVLSPYCLWSEVSLSQESSQADDTDPAATCSALRLTTKPSVRPPPRGWEVGGLPEGSLPGAPCEACRKQDRNRLQLRAHSE